MSLDKSHIRVAMPAAEAYKRTVNRDELVGRYGESTVIRAELAAIMNLMIATGMIRATDLVDIVIRQCDMVEQRRRADANLDEDKG